MSRLFAGLALIVLLGACEKDATQKPATGDKPKAAETQKATDSKPGAPAPANKPTAQDMAPAAQREALQKRGLPFSGESGSLTFTGEKLVGSHDGGFKTFDGRILLKEGTNMLEGVSVAIDMASVFSDKEKLTRHLQEDDFFSVPTYPTAWFYSTSVEEGGDDKVTHVVKGNFTLRGVTKPIALPVTADFSDPKVIAIKSSFQINRKDFGIMYDGMEDNIIKDDVALRFDLKVPRGAK